MATKLYKMKYFYIALLLTLSMVTRAQDPAYPAAPAAALQVTAAEYFIDTDPGAGNGTAITLTPGVNISNLAATINVTGLTNGVHRLYIRTRSAEGSWSLTIVKDFLVDFDFNYPAAPVAPQNVTSAEYFIDTDPGFGKGVVISLTPGLDLANQSASINTASLSVGTHRLYVRFRNSEGAWSHTSVKEFIVDSEVAYPVAPAAPQNVIAAEYFIDTDPGAGSATVIAITPGTQISNITASINTNGLATGTHRLYIRTRSNEGHWSLTSVRDFLVDSEPAYPAEPAAPSNVTAAEYFIDTDPGHGSGTQITVTPGVQLQNIPVTVNTTGLTNGTHNFYLRTRNQDGVWSITQHSTFVTSLITLSDDTLSFVNTPVGVASNKQLIIKNESNVSQTITAINSPAPFTTDFTGTVTLAAGASDTVLVSFTPAAAQLYEETMVVQTSSGSYDVFLTGSGISQALSWSIDPATGHSYGPVATGSSAVFNFTIRNTGNVAAVLSSVSSSDVAFVPTFTVGTSIAAGGTLTLPVRFAPTAIASYSAQLKIKSSTSGLDSVTASLSGIGFTQGTPPVLNFVAQAPYQGTRGVSAEAGQTGDYTYKIVYKSADNRAPAAGYPKVGIDRNGDGDFDDAGEGVYPMTKETAGTNYVAGVVYTYTATHPTYTSTLGYRFFANDDLGNAATTADVSYKAGPVITFQLLDLKIFANDISFSKTNPIPGEPFTLSANISNSSAFTATNVPVKFYRDTILLDSAVIPVVSPFSTATITKGMSFAVDGFYPIKVWIDSAGTLAETNVLNNYAIRPIIVGNVTLPGGIDVETEATVQNCPTRVVIRGTAKYYGTSVPTVVAGAEVTIKTGTLTFKTTTNADGSYSYLWDNPPCGGTLSYVVSVTDFTFTSKDKAGSVAMPCPAPNACTPVIQPGVVMTSMFSGQPCSQTVGSSGNLTVSVTYRARNLANFWCAWDQILKDTVKIFHNGVLVATYSSPDGTTSPGSTQTFPVNITLDQSGPNVIEAVSSYVYNEFFQIPDNFYHGVLIPMGGTTSTTVMAEPKMPDLTIQNFRQTSFRNFEYENANIACDNAGQHAVRVYDSIPGSGTWVLLKSDIVTSLGARDARSFSFTGTSLAFGAHVIRIVTDDDAQVAEKSESNNEFRATIFIPMPDLTVGEIKPSQTSAPAGSQISFNAVIKNSGTATGSFRVAFLANGVQIGNKITVSGVSEKGEVSVTSNAYTVTTADNTCPVVITVVADVDAQITESVESNNSSTLDFGSDIIPLMVAGEVGSSSNPIVVRVSTAQMFYPLIRNMGTRDVSNVSVKFMLDGNRIGNDHIAVLKAGQNFASPVTFTQAFTTPGNYVVHVFADTLNTACEISESNNEGTYHIKVVDSNPDLEVLSQYISPSSLNPQPGQSITLVGTVRNAGLKPTLGSVLRFLVDDIQLGSDVAVDGLQPGQDTTVAATATYSSLFPGVKVMKIVVDPANTVLEEREDNNEATRTMIVGDAPDMARSQVGAIRFESGFRAGDSVLIHYSIKNNGSLPGIAWARFLVKDMNDGLRAIDSVRFSLAAGQTMIVSKKLLIDIDKGKVITEIVGCDPIEYDFLNNNDTLQFSNVMMLTRNLLLNGDLNMREGITDEIPGWIGGKLMLGDFNLEVNGVITDFDSTHFIITNGTGRLRLANNQSVNVFPIGPSEFSSNFAKLTNTGTADHFSMSVVPWVLKNGTAGDTVKTGNVNRTWLVDENVPGGSNVQLELFWYLPDEQPGFAPMASRLGHYMSNAWQLGNLGTPVTDTAGRLSRSHDGYTGFSPFIVTSGAGIALPVELLAFDATLQEGKTLLKWKTSDEINSSYFEIQHSMDAQHFTSVGKLNTNNTPGIFNYQFIHNDPQDGNNYYRLKMVDTDGSFSYSPVKIVTLNATRLLTVYPNPAKHFVTVKGLAANGTIQLVSFDGKVVRQLNTTSASVTINLDDLPSGMYIITYRNSGLYQQVKLIRE